MYQNTFSDSVDGAAGAASPSAAQSGIPTGHKFGGIQTEFTDDVVKDGAGCRFVRPWFAYLSLSTWEWEVTFFSKSHIITKFVIKLVLRIVFVLMLFCK